MSGQPSEQAAALAGVDLSGFAERLLAIIDEGRRTATYKLALLLALIDCCAAGVSRTGDAPTQLHSRQVARQVAVLYWPQLQPFPADIGPVALRQITNKQSTILAALEGLREEVPAATSWDAAEAARPEFAAQVLDVVELTVARYPLVRLQTVDGVPQPVLYDIDWGEGVSLTRLKAGGGVIRLRPGVGDYLLRLAPLIRPLVELHWVRMIAGLNGLDVVEDDLRRHLFGADRVGFPLSVRHGLGELQTGCFYCSDRMRRGTVAVDHFVPWSRWPNDAVENLVLAHRACNSRKSDHVPGPLPLARWAERLHSRGSDLAVLAASCSWPTRPRRTVALARSLYGHLPAGSPVWDGPAHVVPADRVQLLGLLASL